MADNSKLITLLVSAGLALTGQEVLADDHLNQNVDSMIAEHGFSVSTVNDLNHDLNDTSVNSGFGNDGCGGGGVNGDCSISY